MYFSICLSNLLKRRYFFIFACLAFLSTNAVSEEAPKDDVIKLSAKLAGIKTFEAEFTQYVSDKTGMRVQDAQGKVKAERPGKFYWHTYPPIEQIIVSDGEEVTVYDPDLEQATIQPLSKDVASTPALLLSGNVKDIASHYQVSLHSSKGVEEYLLIPKEQDSLFLSLKLRFVGQQLDEMRMKDSLGQQSVIGFDKVIINPSLTPDTFLLKLPPETDVIREQVK